MKRIMFVFLFCILVFSTQKIAHATEIKSTEVKSSEIKPAVKPAVVVPNIIISDNVSEKVSIEFTSGVNAKKPLESTFDASRTIVGTAAEGTDIHIFVESKDAAGIVIKTSNFTINVGPLEIFSQSINLEVGENTIVITAEKENYTTVVSEFVLKRKDEEIKKILEEGVALPTVKTEKSTDKPVEKASDKTTDKTTTAEKPAMTLTVGCLGK